MLPKIEKARQKLEALEANPKHTTPTPEAEAGTLEDDLNDPNLNVEGDIDPGWKQDSKGRWYHPEYLGE